MDKKYFKIKEVSEMTGISPTTIRYWEKEFPECSPKRSRSNLRYYTDEDIETLKLIHYLLRVKGLKIEAAKESLRVNRENIFKRVEIIDKLQDVRSTLSDMLKALNVRK